MADKEHLHIQENEENEALYGVSQETIRAIEEALEEGREQDVARLIEPLHAADVAVVIEYLSSTLRHSLIEHLRVYFDPEVLAHLNEIVREEVIEQLGIPAIAKAISKLESDDALALIEYLDEDQRKEILKAIPIGERVILEEVLTYPEDSAARLMQREIVCVPSFWTVAETMKYMAEDKHLPETFYDIFVVDPK